MVKPTESESVELIELKGDNIGVDDSTADRIKLRDQIAQILIENSLPLDEFLNPEDETIADKSSDIFATVVGHYSINKTSKEEESIDEEEEEVDIAAALRLIETVKLWKLQKGDSQDLQALDCVGRGIARYKSSIAH